MKHTYPQGIQLVENRVVGARWLVPHGFPLERAREAHELAVRRAGIKVMIDIGNGSRKL